jgi:hypothetical protein
MKGSLRKCSTIPRSRWASHVRGRVLLAFARTLAFNEYREPDRRFLIAIALSWSCGTVSVDDSSQPMRPPIFSTGPVGHDAEPSTPRAGDRAGPCIILPAQDVIVLSFMPGHVRGGYPGVGSDVRRMTNAITEQFRSEVIGSSLTLSGYRDHIKWVGDETCLAPVRRILLGEGLGDGVCVARQARENGGDWTVFGTVHWSESVFRIDVQLVPTLDPGRHRNATFTVSSKDNLALKVHDVWQNLILKDHEIP